MSAACNPSSKNVLAKFDDGIYYQTKITSVSENKIFVTYLDNIKRTLTPDKVKIVTRFLCYEFMFKNMRKGTLLNTRVWSQHKSDFPTNDRKL